MRTGNLGWHTDDDSNLTTVFMLNDAERFEGGVLKFRPMYWDEQEYHVRLNKSDMIFFPAITDHAVTSVSNGQRDVLVVEWWDIGRSTRIGRTEPKEHLGDMRRKQRSRKRRGRRATTKG